MSQAELRRALKMQAYPWSDAEIDAMIRNVKPVSHTLVKPVGRFVRVQPRLRATQGDEYGSDRGDDMDLSYSDFVTMVFKDHDRQKGARHKRPVSTSSSGRLDAIVRALLRAVQSLLETGWNKSLKTSHEQRQKPDGKVATSDEAAQHGLVTSIVGNAS